MVSSGEAQQFGFGFDNHADFNVAYTLTLTEQEGIDKLRMSSKACVFVITAKGPAMPDVTPISYNHAKCTWKVVPGTGEDFYAE